MPGYQRLAIYNTIRTIALEAIKVSANSYNVFLIRRAASWGSDRLCLFFGSTLLKGSDTNIAMRGYHHLWISFPALQSLLSDLAIPEQAHVKESELDSQCLARLELQVRRHEVILLCSGPWQYAYFKESAITSCHFFRSKLSSKFSCP